MAWWRSTAASWRKFQQLPGPDRRLLIQASLLLPVTALALKTLGFRRLHRVMAGLAAMPQATAPAEAQVLSRVTVTSRMVQVAARRCPWRANCLQQSLALWWLLRRQGIGSDLRIGVHKDTAHFQAHAWVEYQGVALNDHPDVEQRFASFERAIVPPGENAA